jgi:hypothetical protein
LIFDETIFHLETAANLLRLLERVLPDFSKSALNSFDNQTDFDSAIRRFDPSRPSQHSSCAVRYVSNSIPAKFFGRVWKWSF